MVGIAVELHLAGIQPAPICHRSGAFLVQHGVGCTGIQHHAHGLATNEASHQYLPAAGISVHGHHIRLRGLRSGGGGGLGIGCGKAAQHQQSGKDGAFHGVGKGKWWVIGKFCSG